jgi:hypothetical protein
LSCPSNLYSIDEDAEHVSALSFVMLFSAFRGIRVQTVDIPKIAYLCDAPNLLSARPSVCSHTPDKSSHTVVVVFCLDPRGTVNVETLCVSCQGASLPETPKSIPAHDMRHELTPFLVGHLLYFHVRKSRIHCDALDL